MAGNSKHFIYEMADFESAGGCATKLSNFLAMVANLQSRNIIHHFVSCCIPCLNLSMPNYIFSPFSGTGRDFETQNYSFPGAGCSNP